jgi:hypothetical protein
MKKNKPTIECKPVTWVNSNAVKFQAIGRYGDVSVIADPMPTEEKAMDALGKRLNDTANAVTELISKMSQANYKGTTKKTPLRAKSQEIIDFQ